MLKNTNANKTCTKCGCIKNSIEFSTNKTSKDKLHSWCRPCVNNQRKERKEKYRSTAKKYQEANPEKIKLWQETSRSKPEFKKKLAVYSKKYREQFAVEIKQNKLLYRINNEDKVLASKKRHYQENKQAYVVRAYQRIKNIKNLTPLDACKIKIQEFYNIAKSLTEQTGIRYEVDHIIPISKGGMHHENNLQVLTMLENRTKGDRLGTIMQMKHK